ncbi:MAG TPA: XRE family transcriptional regulator [Tepidisphaeraceae bacterium]|nr:XRE family transcriptional regulator [Tepidisphaeraceae bacterium]
MNSSAAMVVCALSARRIFGRFCEKGHQLCIGNFSVTGVNVLGSAATRERLDMATIHDYASGIGASLAQRIHAMRESRDWTLEMLADQAGLSKAYMSRLEAGDRQPSIAALGGIAKAFGVSIAALFEHPDEPVDCVVVRAGTSSPRVANGLSFMPLSSTTKPFNVHPIGVTIPADRTGDEEYQHDGEEWLYVTAGRVRVSINGNHCVLETGDAAHYDSRLPHRLDAMDGKEARIILVACPIPLTLNQAGILAGVGERFVG